MAKFTKGHKLAKGGRRAGAGAKTKAIKKIAEMTYAVALANVDRYFAQLDRLTRHKDPAVALNATKAMLDRLLGKPTERKIVQYDPAAPPASVEQWVERLVAMNKPLDQWPPMVRAWHESRKRVENKEIASGPLTQ